MEIEFEQTLALLEKLNVSNAKAILPLTDLQEEQGNVKDLYSLNRDTKKILDQLKSINSLTTDEIMEQICYLNTHLSTYIWHIDSMRDTIQKFIYYEKFRI